MLNDCCERTRNWRKKISTNFDSLRGRWPARACLNRHSILLRKESTAKQFVAFMTQHFPKLTWAVLTSRKSLALRVYLFGPLDRIIGDSWQLGTKQWHTVRKQVIQNPLLICSNCSQPLQATPDEQEGRKVEESPNCEAESSWVLCTSVERICSCRHLRTRATAKEIALWQQNSSNWCYQHIRLADQNLIANWHFWQTLTIRLCLLFSDDNCATATM